MKSFMRLMYVAALIALAAGICGELATHMNRWAALAVWAAGMAALCTLGAVVLKSAPIGTVTWRNRFAGYLLPWGYKLGRGKLVPITAVAWAIWVLIGAGTILLVSASAAAHPWLAVLVSIAWVIEGGLMVRQLGLSLNFNSPAGSMTVLQSALLLAGLMGAGMVLWVMGRPGWALVVSGGPLALIGGGYGLFIVVMLIAGRHARWN
jgi:hypothetical protein